MICAASTHTHDMLFHVIFGQDDIMMTEFVRAGASRLHSITKCEQLGEMVSIITQQRGTFPMDRLRCLFFLILNVDMPLKEYICDPQSKSKYATALGIKASEVSESQHSYSMIGTKPIAKEKAR